MRKLAVVAALTVQVTTGCLANVEQGTAFIEGVLPFEDDCSVDAEGEDFVASALLDIGFDAATANSLILPLKVRTNLPSTFTSQQVSQDPTRSPNFQTYGNVDNNIITFNTSEVFFTTDADRGDERALVNDGTPVNDNTARLSGVSGVAFNEQTQLLTESVVITTGITREDAALLQQEPFIADALNAVNPSGDTADNRVTITVNARLVGTTTGSAQVRTPPFPFNVTLCRGCLIPLCEEGQVAVPVGGATVCARGQDIPFECVDN